MRYSRGGVQASPVSADVGDQYLYKNNNGVLDYGEFPASGATKISDLYLEGALTVNEIGTNAIQAKAINATDSLMINGKQFIIDNVTTLTGGGTLNISDANAVINAYKATDGEALVKAKDITTIKDNTSTLNNKTKYLSNDGTTLTNMTKVQATTIEAGTLKVGSGEDTQEVTATKVKGYDLAVNAVGGQYTEGSLLHKTQGITYDSASKKTIVSGTLQVIDTNGASASLMLNSNTLNAEQLGRINGAISKAQDGGTTISGKLSGSYGSEIGNVTFNEGGKISGVQDINDGFVKIQQASVDSTKTALQVNGVLELNDNTLGTGGVVTLTREGLSKLNNLVSDSASEKTVIYAGYGSKIGGIEFTNTETDPNLLAKNNIKNVSSINTNEITFGYDANYNYATTIEDTVQISAKSNTMNGNYGKVAINDGQKNQVIIGEEGIVVGKNSSVVNDDGVFTGGHEYDNAKAAMRNSDGAIKGANGKFNVDGTTGNVTTDGDIQGKDIIATGALKGASLEVTGNATVGGTLNSKGNFSVGDADHFTVNAASGNVETIGTVTAKNGANIGGVTFDNAGNITKVASLTTNSLTVTGAFTTGGNMTVTGDLNVNGQIKAANGGTIGGVNLSGNKVTASNGSIGDVNFATGGVVTGVNDITAAKGTIGNVTLEGGKVTASEGKIGNVEITTAGVVTGVSSLNVNGEIKANTFKVDDDNYLNNNGITTKKGGHIGAAVINETTLTVGSTELDKTEGVTTNKLKIGGMTLTDTKLDTGTADFQVNGVTFNQGQVTAHADKGFIAGTSSLKQGSLIVSDSNKLETGNGLTAEKATINGSMNVTGKATFGNAGSQTTIDGNIITTDTLKANKLILGAEGTTTVEVDKDGSFKAANGKFEVSKEGALKAANGAFKVDETGKTTFTKDTDNVSSINGGNIWAKATDAAEHASSEMTHDYKGLHISGNKAGQQSAFDFDTTTGIGTFKGQDSSTTTINGSAVRSAKSDGTAGKLDGENLTLYKDVNNQTTMSAGKATFKSENAGKYGGTETTIDGGVITTDTLNVQRINLGKDMVDGNGVTTGTLSMDEFGNLTAAGGYFTIAGTNSATTGKAQGTLHNQVGNTSFNTSETGASMSYDNTATAGGVKSEVFVGDDGAKISSGASSIEVKNDGITNNGKTTFNGTSGTTTIDGGIITTGRLVTDELVITGKGNAEGTTSGGSIAFGGDGRITSNIKGEAGTADEGKETTFKTYLSGTTTTVTDGTTTTENKVEATGNTNTVTKGADSSKSTQTVTSIGGVVTNGKVSMKQELTTDGLKISDENGDAANYTQITDKDVSIADQKNAGKRINLSDLGQLGDLNEEITSRDEYKQNSTAVGAINSVSGHLTDEVNRLDGRINDVSDRVNKVGAMAAAIASLKSIGYDPQAPSEFSIGLGQYKGETGVAMGFFHYPNKNFMINVSLSTAGGETMGGIGATWRFGHKSPQKLLNEQREAQAKKELAAAEKYQAAAKLAKEAQERAEYAAKLARQAQVSADNAKAAADATQAKHF